MLKIIPEEKERIIKLLSKGNTLQLQRLKSLNSDRIDALISGYLTRKPIIDEINTSGVKISDLDDLKNPKIEESDYTKAVHILISWLKKDIDLRIKAIIVSELLARKISKLYAFPIIINEFRNEDHSMSESGFYNEYVIYLGNAIVKWTDDSDAQVIFRLFKDDILKRNSFLIESLSKFKKKENIDKANHILISELKRPHADKYILLQCIEVIRKLKTSEAKDLIALLSKSEDKDINKEAKKALSVL
ncbi:hypothetical protein BH09PAT1_BH09PAT1_3180 [soil metagenome]